jgi:hypothetical protein
VSEIEGGSYEVIRARLVEHARTLKAQAGALDEGRRATFGGGGLAVIANERVRTQNNCTPRDMVQVRGKLLFGFNVFLGLRKDTVPADVFSLHKFETIEGQSEAYDLGEVEAPLLAEAQFVKDFQDLYRYYKDARLLQLRVTDTLLLAVFQTGATVNDVKVLRWTLPAGGAVTYVDNRGDRDHVFPPQHDFEWTQTTRDDQVHGRHPHVSVLDQVFVETVNGDLTIKIEDNTESGAGIYSEPVDDPNQSLDDSDIAYAKAGKLLLLRIRPFREERARYFVYNARTQRATRLDAIGQACRQLPEDHGIVFPGGYYLESGEHKVFDTNASGLEFERSIKAPNGEDVLYVFHRRDEGRYVLFPYNLIRKEIQTPIDCNGYSLFADGRMILFRAAAEPSRVHPVQIWQTPFTSAEHAAAAPVGTSFLAKVGNAELVRGISEAFGIVRLIEAQEPTRRTYEDLIAAANRVLDGYYWLGNEEAHNLRAPLLEVRKTAEQIVDEFEKVQAMRRRAVDAITEAKAQLKDLATNHRPEDLASVEAFMAALTAVRRQRGHLVSMKEIRYVDLAAIDALEKETTTHGERTSAACVEFLLRPDALTPVVSQIDAVIADVDKVEKAAQLPPITERLDTVAEGLELVGEIVTQIKIDDVTQRARILEEIAEVLGRANRARALLTAKKKDLGSKEGRAEFAAQFKLLGQSVASSLGLVDTPERADQELARLMLSLEELEARFGEYDEFTADLAQKREEIYEAFGAQKQSLVDARQKRTSALFTAAERILAGARRRAAQFKDADELNGYFTSDAMVEKLRQLAGQLRELGDTVRGDEVESQLKSARQEALRALRDTLDLFDEAGVIKLGRHKFHVNTQPMEPALVAKDGALWLHLGGTDFHERIDDPELDAAKDYWDQHLVSESSDVYRAEHLAAAILFDAEAGKNGLTLAKVRESTMDVVRSYTESRYDEGYERGVHDADAAAILGKLVPVWEGAGLLRFSPIARALGCLFVAELDADRRALWKRRAESAGRLRSSLARGEAMTELAEHLGKAIGAALGGIAHAVGDARDAGRYLAEELASSSRFTTSGGAQRTVDALLAHVDRLALEDDLRSPLDLPTRWALARAWVDAFVAQRGDARSAPEATAILLTPMLDRTISEAPTEIEIHELVGSHARIEQRTLRLSIDSFVARLRDHHERRVPAYRAYRKRRQEIVERERARMRLDELRPKPMSSFVRNRLIDEVYLPVIGDNLAKQIGAAGETKRTDLMGMLLLVSPPGYGKTTLMEYVASRLGLVFVKVNGPALGHAVHSLDPTEAPNATARQEVERINFAFELGNNVMLYLDDIQHTHAELLQKFISLCDGQRKIEGVWKGSTRTYDLRGKKFCVVMAGNPYTESGEKFRIPDMLANRADTYNLGEILQGRDDAFASSYVENALTSSSVLAPLAAREYGDVLKLIRLAQGENIATTELSYGYAPAEISEIVAVMQRLFSVRDVLLKVNAQYIASASQEAAYKTEPSFKLQGSYRNMNKLAEKIVAAMNEAELERLIDDHYLGESQTLTTGAEENLLKLAEMRDRLNDDQRARWEQIKKDFRRIQTMGGKDDDPVTRVTGTLSSMGTQLDAIKNAVSSAAAQMKTNGHLEAALAELAAAMRSVSRPQLEVTVQNEQAPVPAELITQQSRLVETAVLPLVRKVGEQLDDNRAVYAQIIDLLDRIKSIERRLPE